MLDAPSWFAGGQSFTTEEGHRIFYRHEGHGPALLLLHGFPTCSYDWAGVTHRLRQHSTTTTLDFLGYGASDKPRGQAFSVVRAADTVEALARHLRLRTVSLVAHDYGALVAQELLARGRRLKFELQSLHILNASVFLAAYRPTVLQRLLLLPWLGPALSRSLGPRQVRKALDGVRGREFSLSDSEFEALWHGISLQHGHRLAHQHLQYIPERRTRATRWETALRAYAGPLHLLWGLADPVSGQAALDLATQQLPKARVTTLAGVGHFPQSEQPEAVAEALLEALRTDGILHNVSEPTSSR